MQTLTVISLLMLIAFTAWASGIRGTIPESYSQLGTDVGEYCPGAPLNPWSAVTFVVAFLMVPPMIEAGDGSLWQCLGFFAPVYLIVVSLTPDWASDTRQLWVHRVGAGLCAAMALLWLVFVRDGLGITLAAYGAAAVAGGATGSLRRCITFWLEAGMFISVYVSLLIG